MKGGKQGRKRRSPDGNAKKRPARPAAANARRPASTAPAKGQKRKSFGAIPKADDELLNER